MKGNFIKKIIGGLSLTTALFIFQACYGTPQDFGADVLVQGHVKSRRTGLPIKGIKVSNEALPQYQYTADNGGFAFYTESSVVCKIKFEDFDSDLNGSFIDKDTILVNPGKQVYLEILLEDK